MDSRTNAPTCSVRPKKSNNDFGDLVDRISSLPDSILGVILSFLPTTKEAVATTILSKRWKLVWTSVDNLSFHLGYIKKADGSGKNRRFIRFVNRVLHLDDSRFLNKFRLVWWNRCCIYSQATLWITIAISRNVNELYINLLDVDVGFERRFDMPISVFSSHSLRSLHLNGAIFISDSIAVSLPKLEDLHLESVNFESEEAFERLISNCPMLNYLYVYDLEEREAFTYTISSASLKRLEVHLTRYDIVILEASSLEYLKLGVYELSVLKTLSSLVEAVFSMGIIENELSDTDYWNSIVEVVREFDYAKALSFTSDVTWALKCGTISLSTKFKRLVKLEVEAYCCACSSIQDFIQCSDDLEVLTIHKDPVYLDYHEEDNPDLSKWTTPLQVPRCLSNSLKKVVIDGYEGLKEEREMIRYMLEHGNVLEVMIISCDKDMDGDEKTELIREIRELPRKSASCKVEELPTLHAWAFPSISSSSGCW